MSSKKISSRDAGSEMGQQLLDRKFIRSRSEFRDDSDSLYFIISFESSEALNTDSKSECEQVFYIRDKTHKFRLKHNSNTKPFFKQDWSRGQNSQTSTAEK